MRIDARTAAAITLDSGLSQRAIRDCLAGRTAREATRIAIMNSARKLGLDALVAHLTSLPAAPSTSTEDSRAA
jgi:hypothetical protein